MTLDYQECTVNGRPAIELFECETGDTLAFVEVSPGERAGLTAVRAAQCYRAGELAPNAIIVEVR